MIDNAPTYCTPEEVAETLDLPNPEDNYGYFTFTDMTHPSYKQVERMICSNEDIIDRRLRRSWRVNYVKDHTLNIPKYWQDENAWRMEYYRQGGNYIQLRKDVLPWNPIPVCEEETEYFKVKDVKRYTVGRVSYINNTEYLIDEVGTEPDSEGKYDVAGRKVIYRDKLLVRTHANTWYDMSWQNVDPDACTIDEEDIPNWPFDTILASDALNNTFWFDRPNGRLFLKRRVYMPAAQAMRISYRWGSEEEIPSAINRLACILTACQVMNMQAFNVRLGTGGDITGIKDQMIKGWQEEANTIYASYQRPGSVYSLLR